MNELLLTILAYLIGSIPTSVWVSQYFFDIDIRDYGSGNAGATNTYRVLGPKWGTTVMLVDMLKGVVAVKLALLLPQYADSDTRFLNLQIVLGLAAVIGHVFPIWADFRGGKGVATLFGLVLGVSPVNSTLLFRCIPFGIIPYTICFIEFHICKHSFPGIHSYHLQCRTTYLPCICHCSCADGDTYTPEKYWPAPQRK